MQTPMDENEILIRGSEEHKDYLNHRHGKHLEAVNALETRLAIWGRPLLLIYVVYTVVKAATLHAIPMGNPIVTYTLLGVDAVMLVLQVLGLEGSMPGLLHLADEMEASGKEKEAKSMRASSKMVQWMLGATAVDIVLQATPSISLAAIGLKTTLDTAAFAATYTNLLLIARVIAVGFYLTSMAKLSHRGPKVISPLEAKKQAEEQEQQQIRIDNANIMAVVHQEIEKWMQHQPTFAGAVDQINEALNQRFEVIEAVQQKKIEAVQRTVEAAKIGSGVASPEPVQSLVEPLLNRFKAEVQNRFMEELNRSIEAKFSELNRKVDRLEVAASTQTQASSHTGNALPQSGVKGPDTPVAKITNIAEARDDKGSGISVAEVVELIGKDERLLKLSDAKLGEAVQATKSTARRARIRYGELHPEAVQLTDTEETEAVNQ